MLDWTPKHLAGDLLAFSQSPQEILRFTAYKILNYESWYLNFTATTAATTAL
jgi:hypothetical protein